MPSSPDPLQLKRKLSPLLLGVKGVSGLGLPGGHLTAYLEVDDAKLLRRVKKIVDQAAPGATVRFEVTGRFEAR